MIALNNHTFPSLLWKKEAFLVNLKLLISIRAAKSCIMRHFQVKEPEH